MSIIQHNETVADRTAMLSLRAMLAESGLPAVEPASREAYDQLLSRTQIADGVNTSQDEIAGLSGWWVSPADTRVEDGAVLYVHGGGYVLGSANAYRGLASQIASRSGRPVFIVDYALAPENPFPAAYDDISKVYAELTRRTMGKVALVGDSAGGGAALALAVNLEDKTPAPVAIVAYSPWLDLALEGESIESRRDVDPMTTQQNLIAAAQQYLNGANPSDPRVNAMNGKLAKLPPVRIDVGDDEILLDDSLRFEAIATRADRVVETHVWKGMVHVFPINVAILQAADEALNGTVEFLKRHF